MNAMCQITCDESAHIFRSQVVDIFTDAEIWALRVWSDLQGPKTSEPKAPPHFGNRVGAIQDRLKATPAAFRNPTELTELLRRLMPYFRMRATLMHGRLRKAKISGGGIIYVIDNFLDQKDPSFANRLALRDTELESILGEFRELTAKLDRLGLLVEANLSENRRSQVS